MSHGCPGRLTLDNADLSTASLPAYGLGSLVAVLGEGVQENLSPLP